jgi:tRNA threonylcarbamoyladenosine biosynthesis protein TsaB
VLILAIETAAGAVGAAVSRDGEVLASEQCVSTRQHAELLTPLVQRVCEAAGIVLRSLDVVAVDLGPGLFTGLRVGIATALGVAYASGAPLVGVSSLDLLAEGAMDDVHGPEDAPRIVAALDARRGEVFSGTYAVGVDGPVLVSDYSVGSPRLLAEQIMSWDEMTFLVGDAVDRYGDTLVIDGRVRSGGSAHHDPRADVLARVGYARAEAGHLLAPSALTPLYLRSPDIDRTWLDKQPRP